MKIDLSKDELKILVDCLKILESDCGPFEHQELAKTFYELKIRLMKLMEIKNPSEEG